MKVYPKVVIDEVKLAGADHLPDASRSQLVLSLEDREFDFTSDWLAVPEEHMGDFWRDRGYFRVNVRTEETVIENESARRHVALTFHIEEGPQYRLRSVRFRNSDPSVPLAFPPEQLRKLIPLQDGEIFSTKGVREGLDGLRSFFGSWGYIDFVATPVEDIDEGASQISMLFELDSERQYSVGKIEFVGSRPEAESILRSQVKVGEIFNYTGIKDFYQRNKPRLPADASPGDMSLQRDVKTGTVTLIFDVRDCPH